MTNLRKFLPTILAAVFVALCLPVMAAAQGTYDPDGGYGQDGNYRRNRNDDRDNGGYHNGRRRLRESIRRLDDLSGDFQRDLKRALRNVRYDHRSYEDRIFDVAREFRRASDRLNDCFDDGRNLNRSSAEARRVLQLGAQINGFMRRNRLDWNVESDWARIRRELNVIAFAYGDNRSQDDDRY